MRYLSNWTELTRGRHAGKTLPQVVWVEPGYLFWLVENHVLSGMAGAEASRLVQLARAIRIPMTGTAMLAEYVLDRAGRFSSLDLIPAASPPSGSLRLERLDLGVAHDLARPHRDLRGGELLVQSVKAIVFGSGPVRITRQRAERFFEDPSNFMVLAATWVSYGGGMSRPLTNELPSLANGGQVVRRERVDGGQPSMVDVSLSARRTARCPLVLSRPGARPMHSVPALPGRRSR